MVTDGASDVVYIAKLAIQNRHHTPKGGPDPQRLNGLHPMTIISLIGRALRSGGGGVVVPPGEHVELVHTKDWWWLSSLVDWLKEHGLSITMEGAKRYPLVIPPDPWTLLTSRG